MTDPNPFAPQTPSEQSASAPDATPLYTPAPEYGAYSAPTTSPAAQPEGTVPQYGQPDGAAPQAAQPDNAVPQYGQPDYTTPTVAQYGQPMPSQPSDNPFYQPTPGTPATPQYGQYAAPQQGDQQAAQYGQAGNQAMPTAQYGQAAPSQPADNPFHQPATDAPATPQYGQYAAPQQASQTDGAAQYGQPGYAMPPVSQPTPPAYGQYAYAQPGAMPLPQGAPQYMGGGDPGINLPWYGIGFGAAIKRFFTKYVVFKGRASRGEFWWAFLMYELVSIALSIVGSPLGTTASSAIITIWQLACVIPFLAVGVRRLHDTNKAGIWILLPAIPMAISTLVDWLWLRAAVDDINSILFSMSLNTTNLDESHVTYLFEHALNAVAAPLTIAGLCGLVYLISGIVLMVGRSKPEGARFDAATAQPAAPTMPQA